VKREAEKQLLGRLFKKYLKELGYDFEDLGNRKLIPKMTILILFYQ